MRDSKLNSFINKILTIVVKKNEKKYLVVFSVQMMESDLFIYYLF